MSGRQSTILVLDDDTDLVGLLRKVLERDGWNVLTAPSAPEALELCTAQRPDLMIVDLMLPHMDGEAFLEECRKRWGRDVPPVILLTASAMRDEVAERMGADVALGKPFELDELRDLVAHLSPSSE